MRLQSCNKDAVEIFVGVRTHDNIVLPYLPILESLKRSISSLGRGILDHGLIALDSDLLSQLPLFSKLLLNNTKITFKTLSS